MGLGLHLWHSHTHTRHPLIPAPPSGLGCNCALTHSHATLSPQGIRSTGDALTACCTAMPTPTCRAAAACRTSRGIRRLRRLPPSCSTLSATPAVWPPICLRMLTLSTRAYHTLSSWVGVWRYFRCNEEEQNSAVHRNRPHCADIVPTPVPSLSGEYECHERDDFGPTKTALSEKLAEKVICSLSLL